VRQQAFTAVQKILCEELPQIWLMELAWPTIHDKKLHNVIGTAMGPNASFDNVFLA
jgi:peptide/nickel transport system substrate-binding protein